MNQTKHCWQNYVDYHKCITAKGEDFAPCRQVQINQRTNMSADGFDSNKVFFSSGSLTDLYARRAGTSVGMSSAVRAPFRMLPYLNTNIVIRGWQLPR